ncbi:hypothetical protein GE21DRAFT_1285647 [Neurospora crassa]|nr:hypothetical protein GE21DRAFT_1285647 [Neurospora crassa]
MLVFIRSRAGSRDHQMKANTVSTTVFGSLPVAASCWRPSVALLGPGLRKILPVHLSGSPAHMSVDLPSPK